ncbi:hypothetical protein [Streptomyces sp. NPDC048606]|uniref:hypothetical protein n=1 Tax=Streptomyces sp. NPDC048606 TaxID=3154726 RepID=UPI003448209E
MQITWRTQVKRITIAIIAAVAVAGGAQIANEGAAESASSVTADAIIPQAPARPTATVSASPDHDEWN